MSVLNHFHVMPVLGFAAVTVHVKVAVCPSITLYGLGGLDLTSGLSKRAQDTFKMCETHACILVLYQEKEN